MLNVKPVTESLIKQAATESGLSVETFLDQLIERYLMDQHDIKQAEIALSEPGGISLDELQKKYDL